MPNAKVKTLPAPVGGLNAYDSIVGMPDTDAISIVNLIPEVYGCRLRYGYQEHATGLGGDVQTIAPYVNTAGAEKLYGFANGNMFDATSAGAVGAPVLSGLASNIWQYTQFANSAGSHLVAFSGSDDGIWISGAGVQRLISGDGIVNATWKNVDPKDLIDVTIHQRRIWAVQKATTYGWYLPPDQIYGVAVKFDFGPLFKRGGYLAHLGTWTVDDGDGADDMLVAVSSQGDVAVYKGIDPSSANTWALTGVYYMGEPVSGRRFSTKVGGDIKFMTQQGLVSLNDMLTSTKTSPAQNTVEARKVQPALSEAATATGELQGWQTYFFPTANLLFINVPSNTSEGNTQFVENTVNSAWTQFTGYDASHFATYQNKPFFGCKDGRIYQGWTGMADKVTLSGGAGTEVVGYVQQAYSYLEAPGIQKQIGMYKPTFLVSADAVYASKVVYDFLFDTPTFGIAPNPSDAARWDISLWDQAFWTGTLKAQRYWSSAEGMGVAASFSYAIRAKSEVVFVSTDFTYVTGGVL